MFQKSSLSQILTIVLAVTTALFAWTSDRVTGQDEWPSGESVMQRYVDVTGGNDAYDKIENRYIKATLEIVNAGIEVEVESWYAKANKLIATMSADAIGTVHKGSTGNVMWSMSDMSGPVIEEGFAAETQLRDSTFDRLGYWDQVYESAKVVAMEEIDGKKHYKVVLTPRPFQSVDADEFESAEYAIWLDVETGLASRLEGNIFSSAGTLPVSANVSDYREIDGISIAHETKMEIMGQTRIMRIQEIKHNLELPSNKFDPPEEITSLLKKKGEDD